MKERRPRVKSHQFFQSPEGATAIYHDSSLITTDTSNLSRKLFQTPWPSCCRPFGAWAMIRIPDPGSPLRSDPGLHAVAPPGLSNASHCTDQGSSKGDSAPERKRTLL